MQITFTCVPESGAILTLNGNEFQFVYAADVQTPPYYVPMADHPTVETVVARFVQLVREVFGKTVQAEVNGNVATITSEEELTAQSDSPCIVIE